jgi:hypothetical protein
VLVMVALIASACNARADRADIAAGTATTSTPDVAGTAGPDATEAPGAGVGEQVGGNTGGGPGNPGGGDDGGQDQGDQGDQGEDDGEDDGESEPVAPLTIEVTVHTVTPGGQCSAFGTIAVSGGEYPMTVHFQWRRLVLGGGFAGVPVSPVQNVTISGPGEIEVQTLDLPEDGTNVMLIVTGPIDAGSGLVAYDGCTDGPGGIVNPGDD